MCIHPFGTQKEKMALTNLMFSPPPSEFVAVMTVGTGVYLAANGLLELMGSHLKYSKFWNVNSTAGQITVSSKTGMLVLYAPAFLAGAASFWIFSDEGLRFLLLRTAITLHFFKRILEVLFIHKFSGFMGVKSMLIISLAYSFAAAMMIYVQHLSPSLPPPVTNLTYPGIVLFLVGIAGNFYHHILLSKLRQKGDKQYKIPKGGMFGLVICPHYLFEIIDFVGISFISQTLYSFMVAAGIMVYLTSRSFVTRGWYFSKFEDFPRAVKALIPFIF